MTDHKDTDPAFIRKQYEFSRHIRDPDNRARPEEIEDRRMAVYRRLFYKNIESFVSGAFPVLRKLYDGDQWRELVRGFIAEHRCQSPYFLEISEEFLRFIEQTHQPRDCDPAFMLELAHYEWVELALTVSDKSVDMAEIDPNGDMLSAHPVLSPLAWPLSYRWPVHEIGPDNRPRNPPEQPTHIVVFRDRNDQVRFTLINPVTARLLTLLTDNETVTGRWTLQTIAAELQHPKPDVVVSGGLQAMEQLKSQGIILGTRR